MPRLGSTFERHRNAPVRIVGVAVGQDDRAAAAEFQKAFGFPYPTGVDEKREVRSAYRLSRVPTLVLVGPDGKVVRTYVGGRDEMIEAVDQALAAIESGKEPPPYDLEGGG